jgi:hypothetical protein
MRGLGRLSRAVPIAAITAAVLALSGCGSSVAAEAQPAPLPTEQQVAG